MGPKVHGFYLTASWFPAPAEWKISLGEILQLQELPKGLEFRDMGF